MKDLFPQCKKWNNVTAYVDASADNSLDPGDAPDAGPSLEFVYPLDLGQPPSAYRDAAVTNAFYWGNILHDILHRHGFDEASGNFQENNYGRGGVGNDPFVIEVQDGEDARVGAPASQMRSNVDALEE